MSGASAHERGGRRQKPEGPVATRLRAADKATRRAAWCLRRPRMRTRIALYQLVLVAALFACWYLLSEPALWSDEFAKKMAFFFGKPVEVVKVIWIWFSGGKIYPHLA